MLSPTSSISSSDPYEQLIAQIIQLESLPKFRLQSQRQDDVNFKEVLSEADSKISALHKLVTDFTAQVANPFAARMVNSGETNAFTISAGNEAALGPHSLSVTRLARADTRVSARYDSAAGDLRSFFDTNGAQTFNIEVASPTEADPDNRVSIAVDVNAIGTTNDEILDEIATAISTAMDDAVTAGTISASDKALASVVKETSTNTRLSIRSGETGYANRIDFTDSAGGLLALLEVNSANVVAGTTIPATAASVLGTDLTAPITINNANRKLDLSVDGNTLNVNIAKATYSTLEDLAIAVNDAIGGDVVVSVAGTALQIETVATGASASLQITGGNALSTLGLTVMGSPVTGTEEETTSTTGASGGMITDIGTSEIDSQLNSVFELDGLTHYRSSNSINDALTDVTINLNQASVGGPQDFTVVSDKDSVKLEVEDFIGKFNELLDHIKQETQVDADTKVRGDLAGEYAFTDLRFGMRNDAVQQVSGQPAGGPSYLTDLGITLNNDGTLELTDEDALIAAVEHDAAAVQTMFSGTDGVATRLLSRLDRFVGTDGLIDGRKEVLDDRISRLDDRISNWDERLAKREDLLRDQFARLQEAIALFQGQQGLVNSFFSGGGF